VAFATIPQSRWAEFFNIPFGGTIMKIQPVLIVLTVVNLGILMLTLVQLRPATAAMEVAPVLRARALEIVDDQGKVRGGRPSVKISASEQLAGLALVGPSGTKETYAQLGAKGTVSSLRLKNEDGRETLVTP
jgi:hypothetical protein